MRRAWFRTTLLAAASGMSTGMIATICTDDHDVMSIGSAQPDNPDENIATDRAIVNGKAMQAQIIQRLERVVGAQGSGPLAVYLKPLRVVTFLVQNVALTAGGALPFNSAVGFIIDVAQIGNLYQKVFDTTGSTLR